MIKFLHAADFHLDSAFAALQPEQAAERRQEQRQLLQELSETCRQNACDLLLLSGDLFDGRSVYRDTLDALWQALSECGARVFISPGNHDHIHPASPYLTRTWPENVHIFTSSTIEGVPVPELGCTVYGAAFTAPNMQNILRGFHAPEERSNFMVLHADPLAADSPYNPISAGDIADSNLTYLALGHVHKRSNLNHTAKTFYGWPGCPMGRGFDETGAKGVFLGEAEGNQVNCRFQPFSGRRYEVLRVEVQNDPLEAILAALPEKTERHIYRIILTGESDSIELPAIYRQLQERFYALQLLDETVPPLSLWTSCGENTLEGMSLNALRQALALCETPRQRRCIELAARRIAEVCERREMPVL